MFRCTPALSLVLTLASAATLAPGCVNTQPPPRLPPQGVVSYGSKVYLADPAAVGSICTRLAAQTSTHASTSTTVSNWVGAPGDIMPGTPIAVAELSSPFNCYVNVKPGTLHVDSVEVTNVLYQFCVDSGTCDSPDPSSESKSDGCSVSNSFDSCPVGKVNQVSAGRFCQFIGRRLPTGLESIIMRQAERPIHSAAEVPAFPSRYQDGNPADQTTPPATCDEAVVGKFNGCDRPAPVTESSTTSGGAARDVVHAAGFDIYDLTGNVSEWSSDVILPVPPRPATLPWFCQARAPKDANGVPGCPPGQACVWGMFKPTDTSLPLNNYPVCIAWPDYAPKTDGGDGSLFGGNFKDTSADQKTVGVFARRTDPTHDKTPTQNYGFRCVDDQDLPAPDKVVPAPNVP